MSATTCNFLEESIHKMY